MVLRKLGGFGFAGCRVGLAGQPVQLRLIDPDALQRGFGIAGLDPHPSQLGIHGSEVLDFVFVQHDASLIRRNFCAAVEGDPEDGRMHSPGFTSSFVTGQAMRRSGEQGGAVHEAVSSQFPMTRRFRIVIAFHITTNFLGYISLDAGRTFWIRKTKNFLPHRNAVHGDAGSIIWLPPE